MKGIKGIKIRRRSAFGQNAALFKVVGVFNLRTLGRLLRSYVLKGLYQTVRG